MRAVSDEVSTQSSMTDVSAMVAWLTAVSLPPASAPSASVCSVCGRLPTEPNICGRSSASLTGRPTALAHIAAKATCDHAEPLQPKPPPRNGSITVTFSGAMPKILASVVLTPPTFWVASCSVSLSPFHSAMVACGSIGLW